MFFVLKRDEVFYLVFGFDENQIEFLYICWYVCVGCIVIKYFYFMIFGEFIIFVIEVFWEGKGDNLMRYFILVQQFKFCYVLGMLLYFI